VYEPVLDALHARVLVPEPVTAVLERVQVSPATGFAVSTTFPLNPLTAVTVTVELARPPGVTPFGGGGADAAIMKSTKTKVAVAVRVITGPELTPVMVRE
jgi:hypothetical protein